MPRRAKGARLYLRQRSGREAVYVILDGENEVSTSCGAGDRGEAEKDLASYIAGKHKPDWKSSHPAEVMVADILAHYGDNCAPTLKHPELVGYHLAPPLKHFGESTCWEINAESCKAYVDRRMAGELGRAVVSGTARRELVTLSAAMNFAFKDRKLSQPVPILLPAESEPKTRWLTRSEAAALIAGALGIKAEGGKWKRVAQPSYHVARFILIGLYTGTRHEANLSMRWGVNSFCSIRTLPVLTRS